MCSIDFISILLLPHLLFAFVCASFMHHQVGDGEDDGEVNDPLEKKQIVLLFDEALLLIWPFSYLSKKTTFCASPPDTRDARRSLT